jgi:hypothetical protein
MKRNGIMTKEEIIAVAEVGEFIYPQEVDLWVDLDASTARKYLEMKGFNVVKNEDVGTNGWAYTDCGIKLSTNGYVCKNK